MIFPFKNRGFAVYYQSDTHGDIRVQTTKDRCGGNLKEAKKGQAGITVRKFEPGKADGLSRSGSRSLA